MASQHLVRIQVEPAVLRWARQKAGYHDIASAAKRLSLSSNSLNAIEGGERDPTIRQLRRMAKVYQRPLAVLLLPRPPADFDALKDFRSHKRAEEAEWSPSLTAEYRRALAQRDVYLDLAERSPNILPGASGQWSPSPAASLEEQAKETRTVLGMDDWPRRIRTDSAAALNAAIAAVEDMGILVIQTRGVATSEMRGFSIAEWPYPVIALNGADWPRPRLFTLLHELAHLRLRNGGLCDLHESRQISHSHSIEHQCNQFASAVLMPKNLILGLPDVQDAMERTGWAVDDLSMLGKEFSASAEAFLLRLISLDKASWDLYWALKPELEERYAQAREERKALQKDRTGGPSYYIVKARNLGHGYISSVSAAFDAKAISSLDLTDYLDLRYEQVPKLLEVVRR